MFNRELKKGSPELLILALLEEKGLIKGRWVESAGGPRRRYYHLTAKGRAFLKNERETWDAYVSAVNQIIGANHA